MTESINNNPVIFLIEDDLQFKKLLEIRLKSFLPSAVIEHRTSIKEAKQFLQENSKNRIDLVILDQHLPDGRGLEILESGLLEGRAVLSMSSDDSPEIPGANLRAGAAYFLSKTQISQPLVKPLIHAIIERTKLQEELSKAQTQVAIMESIRTLVSTLRHEINNPLGAVLGGAYLLKNIESNSAEQREAAELIEQSGKRIKHVLEQIVDATSLEALLKSDTVVYHIPGDKEWKKS